MNSIRRFFVATLVVLLCASLTRNAEAVQFSFLNPAYTQEIYAGPVVGIPGAWTSSNHLLGRTGSTADIVEYSPTQNAIYQGTNLHGIIATHTITGLSAGVGLTKGLNGFLYAPTSVGLQRIDPSNWAAPAVTVASVPSAGFGINTLPSGKIVYAAGSGSNDLRIYDPTSNADNSVFIAPTLIDDIETSATGIIALAGQSTNSIILLNSSGSVLTSFPTVGFPDGLAFGTSVAPPTLYSNDNQGTITEYVFGSGYAFAPTMTNIIASGGSYGDIATVGPDCAFYVSQFFNGGFHGSALFGTNWDNGVTNNDPSIIRIAARQGCAFATSVAAPEPSSMGMLFLGCSPLLAWLRRSTRVCNLR